MTVGIGLNVDAGKVDAARKSVADLAAQMAMLDNASIELGGGDLARDAEVLRQVSMDVTRLGSIVRSGEAKGGILDSKQWQDAAKLSKNVGDNLAGWIKHSQQLKSELRDITDDIEGLRKSSMDVNLTAGTRGQMLTELSALEDRKKQIEAEQKTRSKYDVRADMLRERAGEYGHTIGGFGDDPGRQAAGAAFGGMRRLAATTLGLAGVGGLVAILAEAVSKYRELEPGQAELGTLGLGMAGRSSYGRYMQGERQALSRQFGAGAGWAEPLHHRPGDPLSIGSTAMMLAAGRSMDAGEVGGFMTGMYRTSGADKEAIKGLTAWVFANTKNGLRQTDILSGILELNKHQLQQAGMGMTAGQSLALASMFVSNWSDKNVISQTSAPYSKLSAGMAAGGKTPGEQLLLWNMRGGKEFSGTWQSYENIEVAKQQGLSNKTYRENLTSYLKSMDPARARMTLSTIFGVSAGEEGEAGLLMNALSDMQGKDEDAQIARLKKAGMSDKAIHGVYKNYKGSVVKGELVSQEASDYRAGRVIAPTLMGLKSEVLKGSASVIEGLEGMLHKAEKFFGLSLSDGIKISKQSISDWWHYNDRPKSEPVGAQVLDKGVSATSRQLLSLLGLYMITGNKDFYGVDHVANKGIGKLFEMLVDKLSDAAPKPARGSHK